MKKELLKSIESGDVERFYKSSEWINKRKDIIKRDNQECQRCKVNGRYHKAECVHHIKHVKHRPDLALVDCNLVSLCFTCHNEVHPEKLHHNNKTKFKNKERW